MSDWRDTLGSLLPDGYVPDEEPAVEPAKRLDTLHVQIERNGRAGKTATIVSGFTVGDDEVAEVAAGLKKALGTGGSSRGGEILIQGDRADDVRRYLREKGYKVK